MSMKLIIGLFSCFSVYSQQIVYKLYVKNQCSNKIELSDLYQLEKDKEKFYPDSSGTIILSEKGIYKLISIETEESHEIKIESFVNSDTLTKPLITIFVNTADLFLKPNNKANRNKARLFHAARYSICDVLCNGLVKDYYSNGNLRIAGTFENGIAVGDLKEYYENGNLRNFQCTENFQN